MPEAEEFNRELYSRLQREIHIDLGRIEAAHIPAIRNLLRTIVQTAGPEELGKDLRFRAYKEIARTLGWLRRQWLAKKDIGALLAAEWSAYLAGVQTAIQTQGGLSRDLALKGARLMLADALYRTGAVYSGYAGLIAISGTTPSVTFSFDRRFYGTLRTLQKLGVGYDEPVMASTAGVFGEIMGDFLAATLATRISARSYPLLGAGKSAPLTNTGRLARSIGVLDTRPRVVSVSRGAKRSGRARVQRAWHAVTVGVKKSVSATPTEQAPYVYGFTLALTRPSRPAKPPIQRIEAWAKARGFTGPGRTRDVAWRIRRKIEKKGTYGRAWLAKALEGTRIAPMARHRVVHAFGQAWAQWVEDEGRTQARL